MIREKARSLYHQFSVDGYVEEEEAADDQVIETPKGFHGSKEWFCCFEKRFGLMSAIPHGKEASADMEEAAKYPGKWKKDHQGRRLPLWECFQHGRDWALLEENVLQELRHEGGTRCL